MHITNKQRLTIVSIYLWVFGIVLFFWWPLSHWFYPVLYHSLLGFEPGSYPDNMVKVIGTTGIVPVLMILFAAYNPVKNKHMIIIMIIFSFLMAFTYVFLIVSGQFPVLEYINVGFSIFSGLFLSLCYPWKNDQ